MNQVINLTDIQNVSNGEIKPETFTVRYTIDSKDRVRAWAIWVEQRDGQYGIAYTDAIEGGKIKEATFKASKTKNIGKSNETTSEQQASLDCVNNVGKKLRSNYFETIELAKSNKLWLPNLCPSGMKWKDYAGTDKVQFPAYASPKLDGARCNVYMKDGEIIAQTRTGKRWLNFEHIIEDLKPIFEKHPNIILDGEGYNHDFKDNFEDFMSIIKKQKPTEDQKAYAKKHVQYHIYDVYDKDDPGCIVTERQQSLAYLKQNFSIGPSIKWLFSELCLDEESYDAFHSKALSEGYEGSILRLDQPYEVDKRSKFLLKRKELFDAEFKILDVIEGEGTNAGIASKVIIDNTSVLGMNEEHLELMTTSTQDAGMAKGWDHVKCKYLLENKDNVIGKMATVEYFEITGHGVLRFPKFKGIRDYD
jgi:DNA ligase-1